VQDRTRFITCSKTPCWTGCHSPPTRLLEPSTSCPPPNILLVPRQPITWTYSLHFVISPVPYLCKAPSHIGNSGVPKHHHHTNVVRSFACQQHGSTRCKSTQAKGDTECGSQQSGKAQTHPPCIAYPDVDVCDCGSRPRGWNRVTERDSSAAYAPSAIRIAEVALLQQGSAYCTYVEPQMQGSHGQSARPRAEVSHFSTSL
jgi:hypothetical protein